MMSSSSSIEKKFKYDVLISFDDSLKNFADHLYHALMDRGIYTYKADKKIQTGERISDELINAIEDSKIYIIVFSKNYASSSWCLDVLVKIMECHKMTGHSAHRFFYDVKPAEVRNQSGAIGEAFAKHKNQEAAEKWKGALEEAADLGGWKLKNTFDGIRHEAECADCIARGISLESKGMEGAAKTTTARDVFDHLSNDDLEAKSFVGNVREVSNGSASGLKKLQEQVLSDVLNEHVTLNGVDDGIKMMRKKMCGKKVLLVLDDVSHIEQLKALAGGPDWFKPGSRILITTRDARLLVAHGVKLIRDINLLSDKEATSLFSRYAFGTEIPIRGFEELSGKVVRYAAGLPLTLEVLGSFLCGKDKDEWEDAIERLKNIPLKETMEKLELSYLSLKDEYKKIFLFVACFLKGESKGNAIRKLESSGFHAGNGLSVLEQRSLITLISSENGQVVLGVHDHIEEMAKNIVCREHLDKDDTVFGLQGRTRADVISDSEAQIFAENVREVSKASMFGLKNLGIMLMLMLMLILMVFICYLYSMASCSNSSAPKLMVSTSNSSVENCCKYDVFLSFRGADTRKNFVGHLYEALKDKGIVTYKDDETIEQGERINDQLLKSIEESRFYIIVFSKNYASSSWCLDELVKIMECQKMTEHTAIPVFYDVDPTQVENQDGPVGEAFSKHKNHEAAGKWRDAMEELAGLAGWDLAKGDESKLIQMIVHAIFIKKYSTLSNTDGKLVGMETRISDVYSSLEIGTEGVIMIGIKGMGGGGKTTLARALYDRISPLFEGKTFVENVREVSQPSLSGLKELQKQILEDVLHKKDITFSGVQDGKNMLKATMRGRKMLVILDNVDCIEQLEALAGEPN